MIPTEKKGEIVRIAVLGLVTAFFWSRGEFELVFRKCVLVFLFAFAVFRPPRDQRLRDFWAKGWNLKALSIFGLVFTILLRENESLIRGSNSITMSKEYQESSATAATDIPTSTETSSVIETPTALSALTVKDLSKVIRWEDSSIYKKYKSRIQRLKHAPSQLEKLLVAKSVLSEDDPEMLKSLDGAKLIEYVETGR